MRWSIAKSRQQPINQQLQPTADREIIVRCLWRRPLAAIINTICWLDAVLRYSVHARTHAPREYVKFPPLPALDNIERERERATNISNEKSEVAQFNAVYGTEIEL